MPSQLTFGVQGGLPALVLTTPDRESASITLAEYIHSRYDAARKSSALVFSETKRADIALTVPGADDEAGVFQMRFCPALKGKPDSEPKTEEKSQEESKDPKSHKKPDPFENPHGDLFLGAASVAVVDGIEPSKLTPTHNLVLNKFPIIPAHFILATVENKPQTHLLEADDLAVTYACLKAWSGQPQGTKRLFAFFNSGRWSGASQPHRHIQFVPVEGMAASDGVGGKWTPLIDALLHGPHSVQGPEQTDTHSIPILTHAELPIHCFAARFSSPDPTPVDLLATYKALYAASQGVVRTFIDYHPNSLSWHTQISTATGESNPSELPFSYNLAMTTAGMAMIPRRREGVMVELDGNGESFCALNGTVLAGTLLVREEALFNVLQGANGSQKLTHVLSGIGIPRGRVGTQTGSVEQVAIPRHGPRISGPEAHLHAIAKFGGIPPPELVEAVQRIRESREHETGDEG